MKKKLVIFYSLAHREFKAFKLKKWLIIFIILASFNLANSVSGQTEKNDSSSSLSGLNQFGKTYPVRFSNETGKKIFLWIYDKGGYTVLMIPNEEIFECDLNEGNCQFGFLDIDGLCFGRAEGSSVLQESGVAWPVEVKNKSYLISKTYILSVLPDDELIVCFSEDKIYCESKKVSEDALPSKIIALAIFIPLFVFVFFMYFFISRLLTFTQRRN